MNNFIHFVELQVNQHLGIGATTDPVLLDELSPGLNIVYGNNGRGKSCMADAALGLVWGKSQDIRSDITGKFIVNGSEQIVNLLGTRGTPASGIPPESMAELYTMSLPELLKAGAANIAQEIRRQLLGNLDPDEAIAQLSLRSAKLNGSLPEWKSYTAAKNEYEACLRSQNALARELSAVPNLTHQLAQVEKNLQETTKWEARQAYLESNKRFVATAETLATFDPRIASCAEEDLNRLKSLTAERETLEQTIGAANKAFAVAKERMATASFNDSPVPDRILLDQLEHQIRRLAESRQRIELETRQVEDAQFHLAELEQQLTASNDAVNKARGLLKEMPSVTHLSDLDAYAARRQQILEEQARAQSNLTAATEHQANLEESTEITISKDLLAEWINKHMPPPKTDGILRASAELEAAATRLERLEIEHDALPPEEDHTDTEEARQILSRWLANDDSPTPSTTPIILIAFACLLILATPLAGWFTAIPACLLAAITGYLTFRPRNTSPAPPDRLPRTFCPASWTHEHVAGMLLRSTETLATLKSNATARTTNEVRIVDAQERYKMAQKEIDRILQKTYESCGILPSGCDISTLTYLLHQLAALSEAHSKHRAAKAKLKQINQQLSDLESTLNEKIEHLLSKQASSILEGISEIKTSAIAYNTAVTAQKAFSAERLQATSAINQNQKRLNASKSALEQELATLDKQVTPWLTPTTTPAGSSLDAREVFIRRLRERATEYEAAQQDSLRAAERLNDATDSLTKKIAEYECFLMERKIKTGTDAQPIQAQFQHLTTAIPQYQLATQDHAAAKAMLADASAKDDPTFNADVSEETVAEKLVAMTPLKRERDQLLETLVRLDQQRQSAERGNSLTAAEAKLHAAKERLDVRRQTETRNRLGKALIEQLVQNSPDTTAPTLSSAATLFASFTENRYTLQIDTTADGNTLIAFDNISLRPLSLAQLSSGTRVQLILAARLAFLETQETNSRPPFILDEALANSDCERTEAIMNALSKIVRSGRQIIYLTAETEEVADWQRFVDKAEPGLQHRIITLSPFAKAASALDLTRFEPPSPPAPKDNESITDYGFRLGVPKIAPWGTASNAHLWYVAATPHELYENLLTRGTKCGQIDSTDNTSPVRRIDVLERVLRLWRINRGRPVTWADILESSIVNKRWEPEIRQAFTKSNGDADQLQECVNKIPKFRSASKETLSSFLSENGFLIAPSNTPLSAETIMRKLRQEFPTEHADIDLVVSRCGTILRKPTE